MTFTKEGCQMKMRSCFPPKPESTARKLSPKEFTPHGT